MSRLGQHFLKNTSKLKKIAAACDIQAGDFLIEIGPGHGELTKLLIQVESDTTIIVIEKDTKLVATLQEKFANQSNLTVISGDVLKVLPTIISEHKLANNQFKLVGNIPYYLTGRLLRLIGDLDVQPSLTVFTIQKEVGEKLIASPNHYNLFAAAVAWWGIVEIFTSIPASNFSPPPKVDSVGIKVTTKPSFPINKDLYFQVIKAAFKQPRKLLVNNLADGLNITKDQAFSIITNVNLPAKVRAQDLDFDLLIKISKLVKSL